MTEHAEEDARILTAKLRAIKWEFGNAPADLAVCILDLEGGDKAKALRDLRDLYRRLDKVRGWLNGV